MRSFSQAATFLLLTVLSVRPEWAASLALFDKINLTKTQEIAIQRVDELLNDFLRHLKRDYRKQYLEDQKILDNVLSGSQDKAKNVGNQGKVLEVDIEPIEDSVKIPVNTVVEPLHNELDCGGMNALDTPVPLADKLICTNEAKDITREKYQSSNEGIIFPSS
nr:uncharacterized protein LOC128696398 [Cherax quadricarinatus]